MADTDAYGGLPGAFFYAFRATDSWICKSYILAATLVGFFLLLLFGFGLILHIGRTAGGSGTLNLSRAFFILVGLAIIAPVIAPVLVVARRRRHSLSTRTSDAMIGSVGFGLLGSLWLSAAILGDVEPTAGPYAPLVGMIYSLPNWSAIVPPIGALVGFWFVVRWTR